MRAKSLRIALAALAALTLALPALAADAPPEPSKQTRLGLYVTAQEAFAMWSANQGQVKVLDVRTVEEYVFVGHAPMAVNIPSLHFSHKIDSFRKSYAMPANDMFVEQVKARFQAEDTILVICRSGQRSASAVNLLAGAGFKQAYSVVDGFEGDMNKDKDSPTFGQRTLNGWRNSTAPWTYALDPALVYQPGI
ncbi:MAG: sulfurtransferase [Desulfarculus sp.]|nr:sulfurtransferase [Desulfarculus sp.]